MTGFTPTRAKILHIIAFYHSKLMLCVVIAINISIFNISPTLNIQLHPQDSFACNYLPLKKNLIFDIVMPNNSLWLF